MLRLRDLIIGSSENLSSALRRMTDNCRGVLFVCDADAHLVGVLSDGDVRRTLLEGTLLMSPVEKVMNTDPITAANIEDAARLLRHMAIVAVPVVDSEGRIVEAAVEDQEHILTVRDTLAPSARLETGAIAIIPARGGSKRIPKKNLALVGGKTLLRWSIEAARNATRVTEVIVSTDDAEIAYAAQSCGVTVPWLRPKDLSSDNTPTIKVLVHAIEWAIQNLNPVLEFGVLLEPTAPLRRAEHIDEAIALLENSDADCVMSVSELPHILNPEELLVCDGGGLRPYLPSRTMECRQLRGNQTPVYVQNGLVYAFRVRSVLSSQSLYGNKTIPMRTGWDEFLDIDTPEDLRWANLRMERRIATY